MVPKIASKMSQSGIRIMPFRFKGYYFLIIKITVVR